MTPFMMALGSNVRSKVDAFFSFYIFCNMQFFCEAKNTITVAPFIYTFLKYFPFNFWFWSMFFSPYQLAERCLMFYFIIFERSFVIYIPLFEVLSCTNIYVCSFPCIDRDAWYTIGPVLKLFFNLTFCCISAVTVFFSDHFPDLLSFSWLALHCELGWSG